VLVINMRASLVKLATIVVAGLLSGGVLASPASAGYNGQQVVACVEGHPKAADITVYGVNQDGNRVTSPHEKLYAPTAEGKCGTAGTNGWWWKGKVVIHLWTAAGRWDGAYVCDVPAVQTWADDWACARLPVKDQ
jgi:hypothetical protein